MLIRTYGDSVSLPRSAEGVRYFETYPELLAEQLRSLSPASNIAVYNRSSSGPTISDLYDRCRSDSFIFDVLDNHVGILQCGIVDCAPRPMPRLLRAVLSRLPAPIRDPIIRFLHRHRAAMLRNGFMWRITPPKPFSQKMLEILRLMASHFARVYVINIAPTTDATEAHSPGLSESIRRYNKLIREAVDEIQASNATIIDIYECIRSQTSHVSDFISSADGHHITAAAHKLYAQALLRHEAQFVTSILDQDQR